ncbi:MAG: radical SAM protein [archaeon]|nr:radical SAM protein [archaeon]
MKVYLINPDYMLYSHPPLGLAYLASYIKKNYPSVEIKILDQVSKKQILKKIKKDKPDVVGISAVSENWVSVKEMAKEIKSLHENTKIIIGGVHVTTQPFCFEKSVFDYGILGEGEIPFTKLLHLIDSKNENPKELKKIKGLLFRDNGKIINTGIAEQIQNLDDIPSPDLELLNMKYYSLPSISAGFKRSMIVLTSRGCPYNCKFCSSSCFWDRKIRFFSAERVVKEIEFLYKTYGFNKISIGDDLFSINEKRLEEIIKGLREKDLLGKIEFTCGGRANLFTDKMARLLKELGIISVAFGFESGSNKVLTWLKGESVDVSMNKKAADLCKKYGIIPFGFFMIGSPYETLEDMKKTYDFIKENCSDSFIMYQTIAYPGTEIWKYAVKEGMVKEDMYEYPTKEFVGLDTQALLTKEVSKEDFVKIYNEIQNLRTKQTRGNVLNNLKSMKFKDINSLLSSTFMKKAWILKTRFLNRIK